MNIKQKVDELFSKYLAEQSLDSKFKEVLDRGSAVPLTQQDKTMLFVGINPSYNGGESHDYDVQKAVIGYAPYFRAFQTLAEQTGFATDWTYMDLFYYRETVQNEINGLLASSIGLRFLCDQLILSQTILEWARPKMIVVCNARSADFFGVNITPDGSNIWMGYRFEFDEECGLHRIQGLHDGRVNPDLKTTALEGVPVCFTSTLKYMDRFSRERLAWQLKLALQQG